MPRQIPELSAQTLEQLSQQIASSAKTARPGYVRADYRLKLITPMFGGGAVAGQPDTNFPVRASSIRGHLRFWWRATRGAECKDAAELRTREAQIWGSTEIPSPVQVSVRLVNIKGERSIVRFRMRSDRATPNGSNDDRFGFSKFDPLRYATFPAIQNEAITKFVKEGLEFSVVIDCPKEHQQDVRLAMWAWTNFGGVGARTRRGFGALHCEQTAPKGLSDLKGWWQRSQQEYNWTLPAGPRRWPTLNWQSPLVGPTARSPLDAWTNVIALYRRFRQGEGYGRNPPHPPSNLPGRSRFPEPEVIRQLIGPRPRKHARLPAIPADIVPRAEFGLPIIFHFKQYKEPYEREPADSTLVPVIEDFRTGKIVDAERFGSPLFLKPLAVGGDLAVPCVVPLLSFGRQKGVRLKAKDGRSFLFVDASSPPVLPPGEVKSGYINLAASAGYQPKSPMRFSPNGSALDSFLNLLFKAPYDGVTQTIKNWGDSSGDLQAQLQKDWIQAPSSNDKDESKYRTEQWGSL